MDNIHKRGQSVLKPYISKSKRKKQQDIELNLENNHRADDSPHDENVKKLLENFSNPQTPSCRQQKPKRCMVDIHKYKLFEKRHSNAITKLRCCNHYGSNIFASASMDSSFILWNSTSHLSNPFIVRHEVDGPIKDLRWSPWAPQIACGGFDKLATVFDVISGNILNQYQHTDYVSCILYHPTNPNYLITGSFKNGIHVWDQRSNKMIRHCQTINGQIHDLLFLPDDKTLISSSEVIRKGATDKTIVAWDFETMAKISNQIYQDVYSCWDLCLNRSNNTFLAQTSGSYIARFSITSPFKLDKTKRYEGHKSTSYRIGFDIASDDRLIATGSDDGKLYLYDYQSSKQLSNHVIFKNSACTNIAFDHLNHQYLALGSWHGDIVVVETKSYYE